MRDEEDCSKLNRPKGLLQKFLNPFREAQFRRLEGAITAFENELDHQQRTGYDKIKEIPLKSAKCYFSKGNIDASWRCLNKAIVLSISLLREEEDIAIINAKRQAILNEAEEKVTSKWRKETIKKLLSDENWDKLGTLKDASNLSDGTGLARIDPKGKNKLGTLKEASEILYEHHDNIYYKNGIFANQLTALAFIGSLLILSILILSPPMGIPMKNIINDTSAISISTLIKEHFNGIDSLKDDDSCSNMDINSKNKKDSNNKKYPYSYFIIAIAIFGALGATISGFISVAEKGITSRIPQQINYYWIILTKLVVGMGSALAIFAFIASRIISFNNVEITSGFIFAISFGAGFSERFVESAIEKLAPK